MRLPPGLEVVMQATGKVTQKSSAIEKSLDILMEFTPHNQPMGTLEVSTRLGIHKTTASRILLTLTRRGFLQQSPETKKFRLGRVALDMLQAIVHSLNNELVQAAKHYMDHLSRIFDTSIVLEQLMGNRTVVMHVVHGSQRVRTASDVGLSVPVHAAAGAKAILAFSDTAAVEDILEGRSSYPKITPNTITDKEALMQDLHETRLRGFSVDNEEIDIGIKAVGVPILDGKSIPIAALVAVFPSHRIGRETYPEIISKIKDAAEAVSA